MKKGCCFIEFLSTEEAVFVYENCNNLQVNNLFIKVKWVKLSQKTPKKKSSKKYSVIINNLIQIYVGNLDKSVTTKDLFDFFRNTYLSVCSANVIFDAKTNESKGFGFVDFTNYYEHQHLLNYQSKIYFHNNPLTIK